MSLRGRSWIWWVVGALALTIAIGYESLRPRPPLLENVRSRPSSDSNETARLEGSLFSTTTRQGQRLFDLLAQSLTSMQDGTQLIRGVEKFTIYTEDGKPVVVQAARGRIQQNPQNANEVRASLEGNVLVRTADGMVLETDTLTYDTARRRLYAPGPATVGGEGLQAGMAGFEYRPDAQIVDAKGPLQVQIGQGGTWKVDAGQAQYRAKTDQLEFGTPFRARQPQRTLIGGPALLDAPGAPSPAKLAANGPVLLSGRSADIAWQLAAGSLDADGMLSKGGAALAKNLRLGSPTSLLMFKGPNGELGQGSVHAERWELQAGANGSLAHAVGGPGFSARWNGTPAEGSWSMAGEWLDLQQTPEGRIAHAEARGRVTATGPAGATAEGALLSWDARRPTEIVLLGEPTRAARAKQGGDSIDAPRLTILRDQRILVGEDNPLTEAGSLRRTDGAVFRGKEPVRVKSTRATLSEGTGPIDFEGPVQAWQEDTTLRAGKLRLLRADSRMLADGNVQVMMPLGEPGKDNRRRVRLLAQHLDYDNANRVAILTGGAVYEEPNARIEADRIDATLGKDGGVESMTAVGSVKLQAQGSTGNSDRLTWTGGSLGIVTLFGEKAPATLESQQQGHIKQRAAQLRYDLKEKRGYAFGGGGRTVLEGIGGPSTKEAPPPPAPPPTAPKEERP